MNSDKILDYLAALEEIKTDLKLVLINSNKIKYKIIIKLITFTQILLSKCK